jgi:hypothetical protein
MSDFAIVNSRDAFEAIRNPNASYLMFSLDNKGDGMNFHAEIILPKEIEKQSIGITLSYDSIDAYIYGLQDIKQKLELQRIINDKT